MGINQALVYHNWAREYSPAIGNSRLIQEITGYTRLTPCWAVMPHHTGEFPPPTQLISMLLAKGIKAVRIFPSSACHNWSLSEWSSKPLVSELAAWRVPMFASFSQVSWDNIYILGKAYPALPIVVTEVRYEELRHLYPLLEELPNLHIDLSWTIVQFGLEALVERCGPERFLFGSRMPIFSAGPALCYLQYADIKDEDKQLIAGDNLRRLLGWSHQISSDSAYPTEL